MSYAARKAYCVECGRKFIKKAPQSIRCRSCRKEYRAQKARENARRRYEIMKGKREETESHAAASEIVSQKKNASICDKTTCARCVYSSNVSGMLACDYILYTGHRRGCLAGKGCDKRQTGKRKRKALRIG